MANRWFLNKLREKPGKLFTSRNWSMMTELVRANFKIIDHNSFLGALWSLISPIAMLAIMYAVFSTRFGQNIPAYPLYLLAGIVPVNFFIIATTASISVFFDRRDIVLNTSAPRETVLVANLYVHFYKFVIDIVLCMIVSMCYGMLKPVFFLAIIPLVAAFLGLILGLSFFLAILFCFARDIEHIWAIASRLLLFVSPVFYKLEYLSAWAAYLIYWFNPVTPFVLAFRGAIMGNLDIWNLLASIILGAIFFTAGYSAFIAFENTSMERA
jgi:ABC-2 type transport system permease protein